MDSIFVLVFQLAVLLLSVIIHEVSHGLMALRLGDETAKRMGRLTLNPIPHLDMFGSIIIPFLLVITHSPIILGWAKPVPYNPAALYRDFRYGPLKVALAGPASNFAIAVIFGLVVRLGGAFLNPVTIELLGFVVFLNVLLAVFNLIPIPPLDGSKILMLFLPRQYAIAFERIGPFGLVVVLAFLLLFSGFIFGLASLLTGLIIGP